MMMMMMVVVRMTTTMMLEKKDEMSKASESIVIDGDYLCLHGNKFLYLCVFDRIICHVFWALFLFRIYFRSKSTTFDVRHFV